MTSILPPPKFQVIGIDGSPLSGGSIAAYIPNTLTEKTTWQDPGQVIANEPIITLDSLGECFLFGVGDYRLIAKDQFGNLIWDAFSSAPLPDDAISAAMAPVVAANSTATAIQLLGIPQYLQGIISNIELLPGPTGPVGPTGPIGPTGPQGAALSEAINIQTFAGSGTWTNPGAGTILVCQIWGAGGGGSWTGTDGGGGGGGYVCVTVLLEEIGSPVDVTIGAGGLSTGGNFGTNGGTTSFGILASQAGGAGGYGAGTSDAPFPVNGPSGYTSSIDSGGVTIISISTESSNNDFTAFSYDRFGNFYGGLTFAGSAGANSAGQGPIPTGGGRGGNIGGNGIQPGGGGGAQGGNGAPGFIVVTVY